MMDAGETQEKNDGIIVLLRDDSRGVQSARR